MPQRRAEEESAGDQGDDLRDGKTPPDHVDIPGFGKQPCRRNQADDLPQDRHTEGVHASVQRLAGGAGHDAEAGEQKVRADSPQRRDADREHGLRGTENPEQLPGEDLKNQKKEIEETMDSFFDSNPSATTYRNAYSAAASSVPTLQVPVQAETREGEVQIEDEKDGFSSVTIG